MIGYLIMNNNLENVLNSDKENEVQVKRGRGRPKKTETIEQQKIEDQKNEEIKKEFANQFSLLSDVGLDLLSPRLPNPIPFSKPEKEMFSNALSKVVEKYFSSFGNYDAEISLVVISIVLIYPRIKKDEPKENQTTKEVDKKTP